jgi:tripartite-type tricarboxylate transporter receptor subunit TctC
MLAASLFLVNGCGAGGQDASGKSYFEGKTVTLIIPNSAGGGHDTVGRIFAPYIEKYSKAKVNVKNVPGAGSIIGQNELWYSSPDGLTICFTGVVTGLLSDLTDAEGIEFDPTEFTYLARAVVKPRILTVGGGSEINTWDDIVNLDREFVFPVHGLDEDFYTMAVLAESSGFRIKAVTGYGGEAESSLAVISGDGDGHITTVISSDSMIKEGDKKPVLAIDPNRLEAYPDIPTFLEVTEGSEGYEALLAIANMLDLFECFFGPPDMDPEAAAAWYDVFSDVINDPEAAPLVEQAGGSVSFMAGPDVQKVIGDISASSIVIKPYLERALESIQ